MMNRFPRILPVLFLVAASTLTAQKFIHVADNQPAQGTCNVYPWGTSTEWRYHALVPASLLGGKPFRIVELGFTPCGSGTFSSTTGEIRMAHTTLSTMTTTFATNLEKDVTPVVSGTIKFSYTQNQWSDVGLTTGFDYNGVDNLVVEVRYTGRSGGSSFHRTSTIQRVYRQGSGAYNNPTGTGNDFAALKMRFTVIEILITGSGNPKPGGTVVLDLQSPGDAGLVYQVGSSLGSGPIPIGARNLLLSPDDLLVVSTGGLLPSIFVDYSGKLDASGKAQAKINILNDSRLTGIRIHSAFVTLDSGAPFGIKSISNPFIFTIL